jgi:hypothetical protein
MQHSIHPSKTNSPQLPGLDMYGQYPKVPKEMTLDPCCQALRTIDPLMLEDMTR